MPGYLERKLSRLIRKIRPYRRLSSINLDEFNIDTIFLDPPREGLDQFTRENIIDMENIIYVSCGFESFKRDLQNLQKTHEITNLAMFDQFPYTDHIESVRSLREKHQGNFYIFASNSGRASNRSATKP